MTTTVRASSPADLAVLLPYQLGYHPGPSVVLIVLHERRLGLVQRHDLPDDEEACATVARQALAVARREEPTALLLLAHEDEPGRSDPLLEAMVAAAEEAGVTVGERGVVRDGRWYSAAAPGPRVGLPLPAPEDVPAVAAFVRSGVAPFASREALVATVLRERDTARAREVGLHLAALGRAGGTAVFGGGPTRSAMSWSWCRPGATTRAWLEVLDPRDGATPVADLGDDLLARVVASLQDVDLRDTLMAVLAPGTMPVTTVLSPLLDDVLTATARCAWTGSDPADEMDDDAGGATGVGDLGDDDHEGLVVVRERLLEVARLVPEAATPDLFALIAHLAWFAGDGTVTGICLEWALAVDPDHRLAGLMMQLLSAGVRPWSLPEAA